MKRSKNNFIEYLDQALKQLNAYLLKPVEDDRDKAGIIQAFEFSFELTWKVLQKIAGKQGVQIASPKAAFSFALQAGIILPDEESNWTRMLEDRNLTSHSYDQDLAHEIYQRIRDSHSGSLTTLFLRLEGVATVRT